MGSKDGNFADLLARSPTFSKRFDIMRCLGEGAAGAVFHVRDFAHEGKEYALKVLVNAQAFDEYTLERFKRELEILREVRHPNLVFAYDLIEADGLVAFTLEYVRGVDLGRRIGQRRIDTTQIDLIFSQILSGVHELHQHGIVHRDLKPENILLAGNGIVKVSDLGLMKELGTSGVTKTGILLGTAQYLPPEYIRDGEYNQQGDIYAIGLMLFECLSGSRWQRDKRGQKVIEYMIRQNFQFPRNLYQGFNKKYVEILDRSLAANPADRFFSADIMRRMVLALPEEAVSIGAQNQVQVKEQLNIATCFAQVRKQMLQRRTFRGASLFVASLIGLVVTMGILSARNIWLQSQARVNLISGTYGCAVITQGKTAACTAAVKNEAIRFSGAVDGCQKATIRSAGAGVCEKNGWRFEIKSTGRGEYTVKIMDQAGRDMHQVKLTAPKAKS